MRILHVSNLGVMPKGVGYLGMPYKISNGFVRNGHYVVNFSDRDLAEAMALLPSYLRDRRTGKFALNKHLIKVSNEFRPDILLLGHADLIKPETIDIIRSNIPNLTVVQWTCDFPLMEGNKERMQSKLPVVDFTFCTTAGQALDDFGAPTGRYGFFPNPVDDSIEIGKSFNCSSDNLKYDLIFTAGSSSHKRKHLGKFIETGEIGKNILQKFPNIRAYLTGVNAAHVWRSSYEYILAQSAMGLNISYVNDAYLYSSDRLSHMVGNGLLVFIEKSTGYNDIFNENEMVFYGSYQELYEKIKFYSENDSCRMRVAESGWKKYHRLFSGVNVTNYMLGVINGRFDPAVRNFTADDWLSMIT